MAFKLVPAEQVLGGQFLGQYTLAGTYIQSPDYVPGVSGWAIFGDGSAEFNNGVFRGVVDAGPQIIADAAGLFLYDTAPAFGSLATSDCYGNGTDSFGNAYLAGFTTYIEISGTFYANQFGGDALVIFTSASPAGPWSAIASFNYTQQPGYFTISGSGLLGAITAIEPGTADTPEDWHTIPLASGWSTVAGQPVPSYQLLPDGNIQITGSATHASFSAATALTATGALPAAYRPKTTQFVSGCLGGDAGIEITTAGLINAEPPAATTSCRFNGTYPVDL